MMETSPDRGLGNDALLELSQKLLSSARQGLSDDVAAETRRSLKNIVATAVGGLKSPEVAHIRSYFGKTAAGPISVLGEPERLSSYGAALTTGLSAHLDDFDDTHVRSSVHASAASFSAAWVAAQAQNSDPASFFGAFAHGCEIQLRVAHGMMPWHYDRGWHMTGTVGALGAAVSAGIVRQLSAPQMANALSFACSQSLGLREAFGTSGKPYHPGKAAANGLLAVELAQAGMTASSDALFGEQGYYAVLSEEHVPERVLQAFEADWMLLENTYKPYPCGLVIHPLIDLGLIFRQKGVVLDQIASVDVLAHPIVRELTGNPEPTTPLEARFSGVHGFALGLVLGSAGTDEFDRLGLASGDVREVRRRTRLVDDESVGWVGCAGTVHLTDGSTITAAVPAARGSLERPLSEAELRDKFFSQVEPVFNGRTSELWAILDEMIPTAGAGPILRFNAART